MKTIGLIGGLSWLSTLDYYRHINQMTNEQLGGDTSARLLMYSVDFSEIKRMTFADDWEGIARLISNKALTLQQAGAQCMLVAANTMHHIADQIQSALNIPLIHIADATAVSIKEKKLNTVALLGTRYTMQLDFYKRKLLAHGIETLIPDDEDVMWVNDSIYNELGKGIFTDTTRQQYNSIIEKMVTKGAQGVIMGCTEIPLLLKQEDVAVPLFDTAYLHARAAVSFALS